MKAMPLERALACPLVANLIRDARRWRAALDAKPYSVEESLRAIEALYLSLEAVDGEQGIKHGKRGA